MNKLTLTVFWRQSEQQRLGCTRTRCYYKW